MSVNSVQAPAANNEEARLRALHEYHLLDTQPEQSFDDITALAAYICGTPIALVTLIDRERQWFKSKVGIDGTETPREHAFCAHTILQHDLMIVEDAQKDSRFAENPYVTGNPHVRFYAGAVLKTGDGHGLGSLCVVDDHPRQLTEHQKTVLRALARVVVTQMELKRVSASLAEATERSKVLSGMLPICGHCKSIRRDTGYWQQVESYIREHSEANFTHGLCPKCTTLYFPGIKQPSKSEPS